MPDTADLEAAIDALYKGPLDAFTTSRNALAAQRRKAGDRDAAERVKVLAKPTAVAWAVNQVWWTARGVLARLLDVGERQRAAHRAFAEGRSSDVRSASIERQQAVDAVVELAIGALGGAGAVTPEVRHRLAGTVEALASGGMPAGIAPGRLIRELQPSGLEALGALAGVAVAATSAGPRPRPTLVKAAAPMRADGARAEGNTREGVKARARAAEDARREARHREAREKNLEQAHARLESVEAALEAAAQGASECAADEERARAAVEAAAVQVAELEAALERARDEERARRRALSAAMKAASEAEMMRARTARDVAAARAALAALQQTG